MSEWKEILVAVDFSEHSRRALQAARGLAVATNGRLTLLHAAPRRVAFSLPGQLVAEGDADFERLVEEDRAGRSARLQELAGESEVVLVDGDPVQAILARQGQHDLIVLGTHGRTGLDRQLLGSVAESVLRRSEIPVLIAR